MASYLIYQYNCIHEKDKKFNLLQQEMRLNILLVVKIIDIYDKTNNISNVINLLKKFYLLEEMVVVSNEDNEIDVYLPHSISQNISNLLNICEYSSKDYCYSFKKDIHMYSFKLYDYYYIILFSYKILNKKDLDVLVLIIPVFRVLLQDALKNFTIFNSLKT
ncbi:MAG: hypothetical protein AAFO15_00705 [Pseudomonadota bacterium]